MKAFDAEDISTSVDKVVELCQQLEETEGFTREELLARTQST